jgi:undecaprenyl-diphosphatase
MTGEFPPLPFDLTLFHAVNGYAGNWALDHLVKQAEENPIVRGSLYLALYWAFWFWPMEDRTEQRKSLINIILGIIAAIVAARAVSLILPFRVRPMYTEGIDFHPAAFPVQYDLVDWSAFPSDTAAYFFAMAAGFWIFSRPLSIIAMVYAAMYICLPRLYLGLHWPSDLVAGGLVGAVVAPLVIRSAFIRRRFATPLVAFSEAQPHLFYAGMFMLTCEMVPLFYNARGMFRGLVMVAHHFDLPSWLAAVPFAVALGAALVGISVTLRSYKDGKALANPAVRQEVAPGRSTR